MGLRRFWALRRLKSYLDTKPKGAFRFHDFVNVAGPQAPLYDVLETMMPYIESGVLEQYVIVDNDSTKEYPDFCALPNELDGEPLVLDRLQLMYRFP